MNTDPTEAERERLRFSILSASSAFLAGTGEVLRERDGSGGGERERAEVERRSFEYERLRERLRGDRERERVYERRPPPL